MIVQADFFFSSPKGFLVLEGVNGAGKSTLLRKIEAYLKEAQRNYLLTREPGSTSKLGASVRSILLSSDIDLSPLSELFLFSADRASHVQEVIQPALSDNTLVLSDRYYYSTLAFQGYGRDLDRDFVNSVNEAAIQNTKPDAVLLLDLDPAEGLRRTQKRAQEEEDTERDKMEEEELAFHIRLRDGFLKMAEELDEAFLLIDASQSADAIFEYCRPLLDSWIAETGA